MRKQIFILILFSIIFMTLAVNGLQYLFNSDVRNQTNVLLIFEKNKTSSISILIQKNFPVLNASITVQNYTYGVNITALNVTDFSDSCSQNSIINKRLAYDNKEMLYIGTASNILGVYNFTSGNFTGRSTGLTTATCGTELVYYNTTNLIFMGIASTGAAGNRKFGFYNATADTFTSLNDNDIFAGVSPPLTISVDNVLNLVYLVRGNKVLIYNMSANTSYTSDALSPNNAYLALNSFADNVSNLLYLVGTNSSATQPAFWIYNYSSNTSTVLNSVPSIAPSNQLLFGITKRTKVNGELIFIGGTKTFFSYNLSSNTTTNLTAHNVRQDGTIYNLIYEPFNDLIYAFGSSGVSNPYSFVYNISSNSTFNLTNNFTVKAGGGNDADCCSGINLWGETIAVANTSTNAYIYNSTMYLNNFYIDTANNSVIDYETTLLNNLSSNINLNLTAVNNFRNTCTADTNGNCTLVIIFSSASIGILNISSINITSNDSVPIITRMNFTLTNVGGTNQNISSNFSLYDANNNTKDFAIAINYIRRIFDNQSVFLDLTSATFPINSTFSINDTSNGNDSVLISFTFSNTTVIQNRTSIVDNLTYQVIYNNISIQNNNTARLINLTWNVTSPASATKIIGETGNETNLNGTATRRSEWSVDYLTETLGIESQDLGFTSVANGSTRTYIPMNITYLQSISFVNINLSASASARCRSAWDDNATVINVSAFINISNYPIGCNGTRTVTLSNLTILTFNQTFVSLNGSMTGSINISINNTDAANYSALFVNLSTYIYNNYANASRAYFNISLNGTNTTTETFNLSATLLINLTSPETNIILSRPVGFIQRRCQIQFEVLNNDTKEMEMRLPFSTANCIDLNIGSSKGVRINGTTTTNTSKAYLNETMTTGANVIIITNSYGNSSLPSGTFTASIDYTNSDTPGGTSSGSGGGGGGGGTNQPSQACSNFDVFIPGQFRPQNTTIPLDLKQSMQPREKRSFTFGIESLGSTSFKPIYEIKSDPDVTIKNSQGLNADWITITKDFTNLDGFATKTFDIGIEIPNGTASGIYTGKIITQCGTFADTINVLLAVGGALPEYPSLDLRKLNQPRLLLGMSIPSYFLVIGAFFAGAAYTSRVSKPRKPSYKVAGILAGITAFAMIL